MSWLDSLFMNKNYGTVSGAGTPSPPQPTLNFVGATVTNDAANSETTVTVSGGSVAAQSSGTPVTGGPFSTMNFYSPLTASDAGGGVLLVGASISPALGVFTPLTTPSGTVNGNSATLIVQPCDTSGGAIAVTLNTGGISSVAVIFDSSGNAGANNITITPSGGGTINGAATYVISANRGTVSLVSIDGTNWVTW